MNERMKYLNLLVLLTFLVGQVQYAYASYFCTMMQRPVEAPTMVMSSMTSSSDNICDECQGVIPPVHGQQLAQGNCVKLIAADKSTVDSFAEWTKYHAQFVSMFNFVNPQVTTQQSAPQGFVSQFSFIPPPLDLPTLNSNLRI
ncbi:MAG TPA: hypothetical protein PL001_11720 [Candidatus Kryptobacter bacterium]|nr:hypothetical protein [Candidatus Kryptobacter bacterium]